MKYYLFIILVVCTSIKSAEIELNDRKLYRIVPESEGDLEFLKSIRNLEPGLVFWNGIGETEEPVDILASPSTLDQVFREAPSSIRKSLTIKYPEVEIEFNQDDDKEDEEDVLSIPSLIPQQDIPETNLKTGTYYKIALKRFPNGYLRTTPDRNSTTDPHTYIIIDKDAATNSEYQSGGAHYDEIQWHFVPSKVPGWYALRNRFADGSKAYTTWSRNWPTDEKKNHVYLVMQYRTQEQTDNFAEDNDNFLWKPVSTSETGKYRLRVKGYPNDFVTWTEQKYGATSHYVQVEYSPDAKYRRKYEQGNEWWDDTLFTFEPIETTVQAQVNQIEVDTKSFIDEEDVLSIPSLIPQQDIPETNLKTGTYYKIALKRFPNGYLRTTPDRNSTTDPHTYIIIDKDAAINSEYQSGGAHYDEIQWHFVPSKVPGWYALRNRFADGSKAYTTWSRNWPTDEKKNHVYLVMQYRTQEQTDNLAEDNDNFLWKPVSTSETGKYRLRVKGYPNDFVTWTEQKYGATSHYVQVEYSPDAKYRRKYEQGNEWWDDTLFTFEPIETTVQAQVKQIEVDTKSFIDDGLMPLYMKTDCDHDASKNLTFSNRGSVEDVQSLQQKSKVKGALILRLRDDLLTKTLDFKNAKITVPWSTNYNEIESQKQVGGNFSLKTKEKVEFSTDIVIPPFTKRVFQTCYQHIELSLSDQSGIPIQVVVEAFCATDRPSVDFKSVSSRGNTECVDKELGDKNVFSGVELGRRQSSVVLSLYGGIVSGKFGHQGIFVPLLSWNRQTAQEN